MKDWDNILSWDIIRMDNIITRIKYEIEKCDDISDRLSLYNYLYSSDDFPFDSYQLSEWFNYEFGEFSDE